MRLGLIPGKGLRVMSAGNAANANVIGGVDITTVPDEAIVDELVMEEMGLTDETPLLDELEKEDAAGGGALETRLEQIDEREDEDEDTGDFDAD